MAVTRKQAEQVLAAVKQRYRHELKDVPEVDQPKLFENYETGRGDAVVPWLLSWESGPDEWAYRATSGGFNEELSLLAAEFVGAERTREMARHGDFTEEPIGFPDGVSVEPYYSFALGIYED